MDDSGVSVSQSTDTPHATIYVSSEEEEEKAFTDGHAPVLFRSNDAVRRCSRERRGKRPREEEREEQEQEEEVCLLLSARNRTKSRGSEKPDEPSICARSEDTQGESRPPHVEHPPPHVEHPPPHVKHPPSSHEKSLYAHEGRPQQAKHLDAHNAHACPRAHTKEAGQSTARGYPDARCESGRESGRVCVGRGGRALAQGHPLFHSKKWTKPVTEAVEGGGKAVKPQVREAPEAAAMRTLKTYVDLCDEEGRAQQAPVRQAPQAAAGAKESLPLGTPPGHMHRILYIYVCT